MEIVKNQNNLFTRGFIIGAIAAILLIVILTIIGELYAPLKDWLKDVFLHHWIGKGVLAVAIFVFLGLALPRKKAENSIGPILRILTIVTVFATLALVLFFVYEAFFVSH